MSQKRQNEKCWFTVYIQAPKRKMVHAVLSQLEREYEVTSRGDMRRNFQTFNLFISPAVFREFQETLPMEILIAYQPQEPKKC